MEEVPKNQCTKKARWWFGGIRVPKLPKGCPNLWSINADPTMFNMDPLPLPDWKK